jgi:ectoine hydroxylase
MKLSAEQVRQFDDLGYVFFPNCFSEDEIALMRTEGDAILRLEREEVWREKSGAPRTAFAAHKFNEVFRLLAHHPRLVNPLEQIFGEQLYVHQFKLNAKAAFEGDVWQWHQDYGTWQRDDDMPEARAMNIALFLDEVTEFNGPLMFIPKSHKRGVLEAGHDVTTTSYPLWTLDHATIRTLVDEGGLVAPKGPAGSVLMFHGNLVHGSPSNLSPWDRTIVYISACHVDNHIRAFKRPAWIAHRDFTPIRCLPDDCLLEPAAA